MINRIYPETCTHSIVRMTLNVSAVTILVNELYSSQIECLKIQCHEVFQQDTHIKLMEKLKTKGKV